MGRIRCAVYTRKSTEEGLDQGFNSLDAQREACEAYIASQRHEGWVLLNSRYDDGGISGGHLDRPALHRLMADIDQNRVDQIVVYKIDRLTRSLADFARLVDRLDAANASFVSVTQSFNTATSMGRLTLNVLLSFAQFEREVTAERIRDKIAASKKRGLWMGGYVPLGYDAAGRTLTINDAEAKTVCRLFELYGEHHAVSKVAKAAERLGLRSKRYITKSGRDQGGRMLSRGHIHKILSNPLYAGRIAHKGVTYDGQHQAIIDPDHWQRIQNLMQQGHAQKRGNQNSGRPTLPLTGRLFDHKGERLSPVHTNKAGRRYEYYISQSLKIPGDAETKASGWRLPARALEQKIAKAITVHVCQTAPRGLLGDCDAATIKGVINRARQDGFDALSLIQRVTLAPGKLSIRLDLDRLTKTFDVPSNIIDADLTVFETSFALRRRGVETKLMIEGEAIPRDETLLRNIALGHQFLANVKTGQSTQEIAEAQGLSRKRVQQILEFAFLSPATVQLALDATLPNWMTTDWCLTHGIPADWTEQAKLFGQA
ncbi:MAG: recombinase family protein [Marinosulfonomonas sp.]